MAPHVIVSHVSVQHSIQSPDPTVQMHMLLVCYVLRLLLLLLRLELGVTNDSELWMYAYNMLFGQLFLTRALSQLCIC